MVTFLLDRKRYCLSGYLYIEASLFCGLPNSCTGRGSALLSLLLVYMHTDLMVLLWFDRGMRLALLCLSWAGQARWLLSAINSCINLACASSTALTLFKCLPTFSGRLLIASYLACTILRVIDYIPGTYICKELFGWVAVFAFALASFRSLLSLHDGNHIMFPFLLSALMDL